MAVRELEVHGKMYNRRPDVIGFVNGIPLIFIELKATNKDVSYVYYDNLRDYKDAIPELFYSNAFIILSNGTDAKVGTVTSPYKFFLDWKRIEEGDEGVVALDTMLQGTCEPRRLMDIFENFLLFDTSYGEVMKLMANLKKTFDKLTDLVEELTEEESRHIRENLQSQEILAIFDLLKADKILNKKETEAVKKVAKETLKTLKVEKLKVAYWRESRQVTSEVKNLVYEQLLWLPPTTYTDEEVNAKTADVYQHIYSNYYGNSQSVYGN